MWIEENPQEGAPSEQVRCGAGSGGGCWDSPLQEGNPGWWDCTAQE